MQNIKKRGEMSLLYYGGKVVWSVLRFIFLVEMAFIVLYPFIYMLSMAIRAPEDMYDMSIVWVPKHFTLDNFKTLFEHLNYESALFNTAIISVGCSLLQMVVCAMAGYSIGRFKSKGSGLLFGLVILTILIPPQLTNLPNYILLSDFDFFGIITAITGSGTGINLLDQYPTIYLVAALGQGIRSGMAILIFTQYFKGIPDELEQAAMIDGCGYFKTYTRIMVPNAGAPSLIVFILSMVWYWCDYYTMVTYFTNIRTLSVNLSGIKTALQTVFQTEAYSPYKIVTVEQAACVLCILPILILFLILQKKFVNSIINSGLVG